MMYGKSLLLFGALVFATAPALAEESQAAFDFSLTTSKTFADALLGAHAEIPEVSLQNVDPALAIDSAACHAQVLKSNWGDEKTESFHADSRIDCAVSQKGVTGVIRLDLSKTAVHRFGNRTMHKKSFSVRDDLARALLKALLAAKEKSPDDKMLRMSSGQFATKTDAMLGVNIPVDSGEDLSGIDCFIFVTLKEDKWVPDLEMCSFVTKEW